MLFRSFLQLNEIFVSVVQCYFCLDMSAESYRSLLGRINDIEDKLSNLKSLRMNLFIRGLKAILEFYFKPLTTDLGEEFEEIIKGYEAINDASANDELFALYFYLVYQKKIAGNSAEAHELFLKIEQKFPFQLYNSLYILYRYSNVLAILNEKEKLKLLLDKYMSRHLRSYDPDAYILTCVSYSVYHLLKIGRAHV